MQEPKIQQLFILKTFIGGVFGCLFFVAIASGLFSLDEESAFGWVIYAVIFIIAIGASMIMVVLRMYTFSYDLGEDVINIRQGILSRQERHVPYAVIQNVVLRQDLLDRVFGLTTIVVENASMGGAVMPQYNNRGAYGGYGRNYYQMYNSPGMTGNMFVIPGLNRGDALALRDRVLEKTEKAVAKTDGKQL